MLYNENFVLIMKCRYFDYIETSAAITCQCGLWYITQGHKFQAF